MVHYVPDDCSGCDRSLFDNSNREHLGFTESGSHVFMLHAHTQNDGEASGPYFETDNIEWSTS